MKKNMKKAFLAFSASPAFAFVLTMGIVNLFADMTYEGGGSINGPFMGMLGASAAAISIVAGLGRIFRLWAAVYLRIHQQQNRETMADHLHWIHC